MKELEDPLIALGFVSSQEKVKELVAEVDEDGSGKVEFDEFLLIMRSIKKKEKEGKGEDTGSSLNDFFKDMVEGNFSKMGDMDNEMPFTLNYSMYRRRRIMDAIMSEDSNKRKDGQKIMNVILVITRISASSLSKIREKKRKRKEKIQLMWL